MVSTDSITFERKWLCSILVALAAVILASLLLVAPVEAQRATAGEVTAQAGGNGVPAKAGEATAQVEDGEAVAKAGDVVVGTGIETTTAAEEDDRATRPQAPKDEIETAENTEAAVQTNNVEVVAQTGDEGSASVTVSTDDSTQGTVRTESQAEQEESEAQEEVAGQGSQRATQTAARQPNGACANAEEVVSVGPTTVDSERQFRITGETFRVTYDVAILDEDELPTVTIDISGRFGAGPLVFVEETESDSFISTEGPGTFDLTVSVNPPNTARYTVTVEDCGGNGGGNGDGGGAEDTTNNFDDLNCNQVLRLFRNDENDQYFSLDGELAQQIQVCLQNEVIVGSDTDDPLPKTGGPPLLALAALGLASAALGASVLRAGLRREG